jgi:hypothetical protein
MQTILPKGRRDSISVATLDSFYKLLVGEQVMQEDSNNIVLQSESYGVVTVETNPDAQKTKSFIDLLNPFIKKQAYQENNTGNKMFMFGLRWTRKVKAFNPLNISSYANKGLPITDSKAKDGYVYDTLDQNGNELPQINELQPIIDDIQKSLGIDMKNYDAVIANIYLPGQRIQTHRDTTESLSARNYPVIVYTLGNDSGINIYKNAKNPGSASFTSDVKQEIKTKNGSIYTFGLDGKGRFEMAHDTPHNVKRNVDYPPITMPDGSLVTNYTITLTFRRAGDLTSNMSVTPKKLFEQKQSFNSQENMEVLQDAITLSESLKNNDTNTESLKEITEIESINNQVDNPVSNEKTSNNNTPNLIDILNEKGINMADFAKLSKEEQDKLLNC